MSCLVNWNGPFYKSVYPIRRFASLAQREKKRRSRKKLERGTVKGESWRDKPTDGKLRGKESSSLIKQNNCWAQLAPMASDAQCRAELYDKTFQRRVTRYIRVQLPECNLICQLI
jgi:hypothetical protein